MAKGARGGQNKNKSILSNAKFKTKSEFIKNLKKQGAYTDAQDATTKWNAYVYQIQRMQKNGNKVSDGRNITSSTYRRAVKKTQKNVKGWFGRGIS